MKGGAGGRTAGKTGSGGTGGFSMLNAFQRLLGVLAGASHADLRRPS